MFDVGGSLGTNFYQNRKLLSELKPTSVQWNVIELPATAALGRAHFQTKSLRFFDSIEAACDDTPERPQAVLFSGSLQYAPEPLKLVERAIATEALYLAFDRLLMSPAQEDQIFVQRPDPKVFYSATYPVWCFSHAVFLSTMRGRGLHLVESFIADAHAYFDHCGLLFRC